MSMFSQRTNWEFEKNPLMAELERLKQQGADILDLTESNPTHCEFSYPSSKILKSLGSESHLDYRPSPLGTLEARESVAQYYADKGFTVTPEKIFLSASTSESYSFIFRLLMNPGESVLVPTPSYPLFQYLAELNDIEILTYPLSYRDGWKIESEKIVSLLRANTRALILVNPNNPTGSYIKSHELEAINRLAKDHNLALISDEVFWDFPLEEPFQKFVSTVQNDSVLTFTMGGASKTLGLPQMKLAWTHVSGPEKAVAQALERLEVILDTYLSVNTPVMNSIHDWLLLRSEIQEQMLSRLRQNYDFIQESLPEMKNVSFLKAEGGWYAVLKLPDILSEDEWALEFLRKDHVFIHPGYFFDFDQESYMVLSLLPSLSIFQEGLRRILARIKKHPR